MASDYYRQRMAAFNISPDYNWQGTILNIIKPICALLRYSITNGTTFLSNGVTISLLFKTSNEPSNFRYFIIKSVTPLLL